MPRIDTNHPLQARLAPTESPSMLDIAWAAGVYEGEGSCIWKKSRTTRAYGHMTLVITQKDRWILDRFRRLFGGSVHVRERDMHVWFLHGARARGVAMTIYKFLSPRRQSRIKECLFQWRTA